MVGQAHALAVGDRVSDWRTRTRTRTGRADKVCKTRGAAMLWEGLSCCMEGGMDGAERVPNS